jgi:hypothetical protein
MGKKYAQRQKNVEKCVWGAARTYHLNLLDPVANGKESGPIGYIVHQQYSLSTTKVRSSDGAEPFLSGGVPNLQFYSLIPQLDILNFEINTDGGDEGWGEGFVRISK